MPMPLPSKVYYVQQRGAKLRYGQKGGGLFANLVAAWNRRSAMKGQGAEVTLYEADVNWVEVVFDEED